MDDLLTIKETAALMKVTDRTIRRWIADGRLDASKIARTVRIRRTALEALVLPGQGKTQHPDHSRIEALGTPSPSTSNAPVTMPKTSHIPSENETGSPVISEFHDRVLQAPTSDLDLLVAFRETPGLLKYIELEHYLSDLIGVKVDLAMGDALKARVGENAQQEVALV